MDESIYMWRFETASKQFLALYIVCPYLVEVDGVNFPTERKSMHYYGDASMVPVKREEVFCCCWGLQIMSNPTIIFHTFWHIFPSLK